MRTLAIAVAAIVIASPADAETAAGAVHMTPAPGVSFDLPDTWIACDDATNKRLGDHPDPHGLKSKVCVASPDVPYKFRAFNPILFRTIAMLLDQHDKQDVTPEDLASITPEIAKAISPQTCEEVVKPIASGGATINNCEVTIDTFANMKALHSVVIATPASGLPIAKFQIDIYEMPYAHGYLQVQFNTPAAFRSATAPEINAIISSFKIE